MLPFHSIKQFLNDMRRQKLRTVMTMFGIFWGTCSIVLLFAFGKGLGEAQIKSQKGLGENIAIFWPGVTSKEFKGLPRGRTIRFTEEDVMLVKSKAQTVLRISPEYSKWQVMFQVGRNSTIRQVAGIWPEFGEMRNLIPQSGSRFINDLDMQDKRRVVFIGDGLAKDLFGTEDPVGKQILVNGAPFTVVGVLKHKEQDSSYSGRDEYKAFIPSTTFRTMFSAMYLNDFVAQSKLDVPMLTCRHEINEVMGQRFRYDPDDKEALPCWDTTEGIAFLKTFFMAFQMFLVGIGVATLITGAIGVSNIMNVVLEERTKEIGIKMALGARKSTILWQFVVETFMITGMGGLLGFAFAWVIVAIFPMFKLQEYIGTPSIDMANGLVAVGLLGVIGFCAGIFPARRAANLQPVQALKLF